MAFNTLCLFTPGFVNWFGHKLRFWSRLTILERKKIRQNGTYFRTFYFHTSFLRMRSSDFFRIRRMYAWFRLIYENFRESKQRNFYARFRHIDAVFFQCRCTWWVSYYAEVITAKLVYYRQRRQENCHSRSFRRINTSCNVKKSLHLRTLDWWHWLRY